MIKVTARAGDGRTLLILGLSAANIDALKKDQPIFFDAAQLHIPKESPLGPVCLFYGETEEAMKRALGSLIGPQTDVFDVPPAPKREQ